MNDKSEIQVIKVIDWNYVSIKPDEEGILCKCGKAILFRTESKITSQTITFQCPECGRKTVYG